MPKDVIAALDTVNKNGLSMKSMTPSSFTDQLNSKRRLLSLLALGCMFIFLSNYGFSRKNASHADNSKNSYAINSSRIIANVVFVLSEDVINLPRQLSYDRIIRQDNVQSQFNKNSQPFTRVLVVSKQYLSALKESKDVFSDPKYKALVTVFSNSHMVFFLDSTTADIIVSMQLSPETVVWDPRRQMPLCCDPDYKNELLGTGLHFRSDLGWSKLSLLWSSLTSPSAPNYQIVDYKLRQYIREEFGDTKALLFIPNTTKGR